MIRKLIFKWIKKTRREKWRTSKKKSGSNKIREREREKDGREKGVPEFVFLAGGEK